MNSNVFRITVFASTFFALSIPGFADNLEKVENVYKAGQTKVTPDQQKSAEIKQKYLSMMEKFYLTRQDYADIWKIIDAKFYAPNCYVVNPMHDLFKARTAEMKKIEDIHAARKQLILVTSKALVDGLDKSRGWDVPADIYDYHRALKISTEHLRVFDEWDQIKPF